VHHQAAHGGQAARRPQHRDVAVEAVEHPQSRELRQVRRDGRVEVEQPALGQLQGDHARDDLGHRGDPEQAVDAHRPGGTGVDHAVGVRDQGHGVRHLPGGDGARQHGVDALAGERHPGPLCHDPPIRR